MKTFNGTYFPNSAETVPATVLVTSSYIQLGYISGQPQTIRFNLSNSTVSYDPSSAESVVKMNGDSLRIPGKDAYDFILEMQNENALPWHRTSRGKEVRRNVILFLAIVAAIVLLYFMLVPWMSAKMADKVSIKTQESFGNTIYNAMGLPGEEDSTTSILLNEFFMEMNISSPYNIRITAIRGDVINAFALPGGRIVVYTSLLQEITSYPELAALLSHEFTHVANRHSTKSVFRRMGSKIFIGMVFGNFGKVAAVLADHADDLKSLNYSRKLEKEADMNGLRLLAERKIDPKGFEDLFNHLKSASPGKSQFEFLASHPDTDRRIAYIKEASKNTVHEENTELKSIFEKIKTSIK